MYTQTAKTNYLLFMWGNKTPKPTDLDIQNLLFHISTLVLSLFHTIHWCTFTSAPAHYFSLNLVMILAHKDMDVCATTMNQSHGSKDFDVLCHLILSVCKY